MNKLMKPLFIGLLFIVSFYTSIGQDLGIYQTPPKVISDLLLAPPTPMVSVDSKGNFMLVMERNSYPTVEELGQPELKIAGLRINPNNASLSRQTYINRFIVRNIKLNKDLGIKGLPTNLAALNPTWNKNENKIAFFNVINYLFPFSKSAIN